VRSFDLKYENDAARTLYKVHTNRSDIANTAPDLVPSQLERGDEVSLGRGEYRRYCRQGGVLEQLRRQVEHGLKRRPAPRQA
jgi:hypothetical protein